MDWICNVYEHKFSEEFYYAVTINASRLQQDHKSSFDYCFELFNKSNREVIGENAICAWISGCAVIFTSAVFLSAATMSKLLV